MRPPPRRTSRHCRRPRRLRLLSRPRLGHQSLRHLAGTHPPSRPPHPRRRPRRWRRTPRRSRCQAGGSRSQRDRSGMRPPPRRTSRHCRHRGRNCPLFRHHPGLRFRCCRRETYRRCPQFRLHPSQRPRCCPSGMRPSCHPPHPHRSPPTRRGSGGKRQHHPCARLHPSPGRIHPATSQEFLRRRNLR